MPIRADYCDAWFTACAEDLFCADDGGDYYSCSKILPTTDSEVITLESKADVGLIVGVVIAIVFVIILCVVLGYMRHREQRGRPLFETMLTPEEQAASSQTAMRSGSDVTAGINTTSGGAQEFADDL